MNEKLTDNTSTDIKKTDTSMRQETSYSSGILNQLFTKTLGSQALSRSWWQHWVYPVLFLLTLTLSLATYLTLDSVQQSVDRYINDNQRALVGGDLILNSKQDWPSEVLAQVETIPDTQTVYDYQFSAMLVTDEQTLLASVKAVTPSYPLYGTRKAAVGATNL